MALHGRVVLSLVTNTYGKIFFVTPNSSDYLFVGADGVE